MTSPPAPTPRATLQYMSPPSSISPCMDSVLAHEPPLARPPADSALRVEVYSSFEAANFIRAEWTRLLNEMQGDLFGSFEWCSTWWRHFSKGRQLEIYAFWHRK